MDVVVEVLRISGDVVVKSYPSDVYEGSIVLLMDNQGLSLRLEYVLEDE